MESFSLDLNNPIVLTFFLALNLTLSRANHIKISTLKFIFLTKNTARKQCLLSSYTMDFIMSSEQMLEHKILHHREEVLQNLRLGIQVKHYLYSDVVLPNQNL